MNLRSAALGQVTATRRHSLPVSLWIAIAVLAAWIVVALVGPALAPHGEGQVLGNDSFAPPGAFGLLGSDYLGRDLWSRLLFGARRTLGLAAIVAMLAFTIGVGAGFLAAIVGGWLDTTLSRLNDALLAFPSLILALIVIAALGTSVPILVATVALIEATRIYRIARALAMDVLVMDFVDAARARGEGALWIMRSEILPSVTTPLAAEFGVRYVYAILFISALSFLGLGVQPPGADWGVMVRENLQGLLFGSFAPVIPAAAIASVTVAINLMVDWWSQRSGRDLSSEQMP